MDKGDAISRGSERLPGTHFRILLRISEKLECLPLLLLLQFLFLICCSQEH